MKYFLVFLTFFIGTFAQAQDAPLHNKVKGTIINANTGRSLPNVNIINVNKVKGSVSNTNGYFEIDAESLDTLHITMVGYQSIKVKVTNDWIKNGDAKIKLTEKAIALEEVVVRKYNLTGYLEVDTKLIPTNENYRYSISGLPNGPCVWL